MIYFNGERWMPFENIISFTEKMVVFDNDIERYEGKKDLQITPFKLSIEEARRLDEIKNVTTMSLIDIEKYVKGEPLIEEPSADMLKALDKAKETRTIREAIDFDTIPDEVLLSLDFLKKDFKHGIYIEKNDLVIYDGVIYLAAQSHIASDLYPPGPGTEALYAKLLTPLDGTILDWEQPESTNGYPEGAKVRHKGKIWISTHKGLNVWEPGAPGTDDRIWKMVEDAV